MYRTCPTRDPDSERASKPWAAIAVGWAYPAIAVGWAYPAIAVGWAYLAIAVSGVIRSKRYESRAGPTARGAGPSRSAGQIRGRRLHARAGRRGCVLALAGACAAAAASAGSARLCRSRGPFSVSKGG